MINAFIKIRDKEKYKDKHQPIINDGFTCNSKKY